MKSKNGVRKYKCQYCNSYYMYGGQTSFIDIIDIINPDCNCYYSALVKQTCDKCDCHANSGRRTFKLEE